MKQLVTGALLLMLFSCGESKVPYADNNCKLVPPFVGRLGFSPRHAYFTTAEKRTAGLVLLEAGQAGAAGRRYQDSSWTKAGGLSAIQIDNRGNIFTVPAPFINVLNNKINDQNTIYRVDGETGTMNAFLRLPLPDSLSADNPYGILGLTLLCETGSLYVSTVAGSDRLHENGVLYAISIAGAKTTDRLKGIDAIGLGIVYNDGERRLFFGKARTPEIWSVKLDKRGQFSGSPRMECSLAGLGPRGDDKARRIRSTSEGVIEVNGTAFGFNLIAPTERQETVYRFVYDAATKKWQPQLPG